MELASCRRSCSVIDAGSPAFPGLLRTPVDSSRFEPAPDEPNPTHSPALPWPRRALQAGAMVPISAPAGERTTARSHDDQHNVGARRAVVRCARLHCFYARRRITTQPRKRSTGRSLPAAGHCLENRWTCKRPLGSNPSPAALQPTLESASSAFAPPLGRGRRELRSGRMQSLRGRMSHPDRQ